MEVQRFPQPRGSKLDFVSIDLNNRPNVSTSNKPNTLFFRKSTLRTFDVTYLNCCMRLCVLINEIPQSQRRHCPKTKNKHKLQRSQRFFTYLFLSTASVTCMSQVMGIYKATFSITLRCLRNRNFFNPGNRG